MPDVIEIRGLQELLRKIGRMDREVKPVLTKATERALLYVHSQVPDYPATRPDQTYVRTGTLGRSIITEVKPIGADIVGKIGTNVVYSPWVIDDKRQAWMHKGRWWTLQGVVRKARGTVVNIYIKAIKDWLR